VTSLKDRQRAAARARLEREMSIRQEQAARRRQRRIWSGTTALAVIVVVVLVVVIVDATGDKSKKKTTATPASTGPATCAWDPNPNPSPSPKPTAPPPVNKDLIKTGTPPTTGIAHTGTRDFTLNTNLGKITVAMDLSKAPCASESMAFLSSKKFFDKTDCEDLVSGGPYLLICGDPSGKGDGGPNYTYKAENLPTDQRPNYAEADVAILNQGSGNGSAFFIVYKDTPVTTDPSSGSEQPDVPSNFTILGQVTSGMDVVQKVAAGGAKAADANGMAAPKIGLTINTTTVAPAPAP
jgi:peptidyl-prolyl cis-trans isomerase B (cyclophilin B)